jgi:hypothetical protein
VLIRIGLQIIGASSMIIPQVQKKIRDTMEVLELAGIDSKIAEEQAVMRVSESLQRQGYKIYDSVMIVEKAMRGINEK